MRKKTATTKKKRMNIEDFIDEDYKRRTEEAERKYAEQCKPSEVITKKIDPDDLEKKYKTEKGKVPCGVTYAEIYYKKRGTSSMSKQKALKMKVMEFEGKSLTYRIQEENIVSIIKGNQGIRVEPKEIDTIIQELQELKGVVSNG